MTYRTRGTKLEAPLTERDKYDKSGIYQLRYLDCTLKYIVQDRLTVYFTRASKNIYRPYATTKLIPNTPKIYSTQSTHRSLFFNTMEVTKGTKNI
jgi:hypothetical protein